MIEQTNFGAKVGVLGSGRSIYVASLFVLNIGLARSLGTEGYGSFQQVFMFNYLFLIFTLGIPETLYFFLPRLNEQQRSAFLGQTILLLSLTSLGIYLALLFGAPFLARSQWNPAIAQDIKLFGIYGAFWVFSSFADPVFIYFQRIRYLFILSATHGLFFIALTVWHSLTQAPLIDLFSAMAMFGAFKCVLASSLFFTLKKTTGPLDFALSGKNVMLQLSFAVPIALTNSIESISRWLDKLVVSLFLGTQPLGLFTVGAIEIPFVSVFVSTVFGLYSPMISELDHKHDSESVGKILRHASAFTAKAIWPLFIYLLVFADHIIPLVFTHSYDDSVLPFRIYLLMLPIRIMLFGIIIIALGRPRIVLFGAAGALLIDFVLNIVLVQWIGFIGPAIATVVSTYLEVIYMFWYILWRLNTRIRDVLPLLSLFDIALSSLLAAAIAYLLTSAFLDDTRVVLTSLTIMLGAYIFVGSRLGLFRILSPLDLFRGNIFGNRDKDKRNQ